MLFNFNASAAAKANSFFKFILLISFVSVVYKFYPENVERSQNGRTNVEKRSAEVESGNIPMDSAVTPSDTDSAPVDVAEVSMDAVEVDPPKQEYLALCVAIKDQHADMQEWLVHHYYHMNVSRFYIMDDRSDPPLSTYQNYSIPRSALTFNHYQEKAATLPPGNMQLWIYEECNRLYGDKHAWMGFIDVDEYLEVRTKNETFQDILEHLDEDENIGQLSVNWKTHTSAGLPTPPESVRQGFVLCTDEELDESRGDKWLNRHVKAFVKSGYMVSIITPHFFKLKGNAITVGEDEQEVSPGFAWRIPVTRNRLSLHHYTVKSRQDYAEKLARWKSDLNYRGWEAWDDVHAGVQEVCFEMTHYNP